MVQHNLWCLLPFGSYSLHVWSQDSMGNSALQPGTLQQLSMPLETAVGTFGHWTESYTKLTENVKTNLAERTRKGWEPTNLASISKPPSPSKYSYAVSQSVMNSYGPEKSNFPVTSDLCANFPHSSDPPAVPCSLWVSVDMPLYPAEDSLYTTGHLTLMPSPSDGELSNLSSFSWWPFLGRIYY